MGTEQTRSRPSKEKQDKLSAPPGFVSRTSFTLKRVENNEESSIDSTCDIIDIAKLKRSIEYRPWILYSQSNNSQDESPPEQLHKSLPSQTCLPKGVVRGCLLCSNCQKVTARWCPEDAHMAVLEDAPLFHPTEEEFGDLVKYIANIRSRVEPYGICRIVPPSSWKPPCIIKEKNTWENSKFVTHIQRIDELRKDLSKRNMARMQDNIMNKRRKSFKMSTGHGGNECTTNLDQADCCKTKGFEFESGPEFNLKTFEKSANEFKGQYFCKTDEVTDSNVNSAMSLKQSEPSIEHVEGEYWRIVENPTEEIEILHGADLGTGDFGSGFPVVSNPLEISDYSEYLKSDWNLNNIPKLPGSLLSFETCGTSGILLPRMYIGMCFSSLCWKAEEHLLYSLWYLHLGAPRIWYGISGKYFTKFQTAVKKYFPDLIGERPELLHKLIRQLPPSILKSEGIPVYRCVQYPREFVLILPGAYHSGFDCGFNCTEVGNFAPIDWLPHGQNAVELYCEQGMRTSISLDKLLFEAANEAVKAQWELSVINKNTPDNVRWKDVCEEGILARALKSRIKSEDFSRKYLCNSERFQRMEKSFDASSKRVCSICLCDLHLSAACCPCSSDRYACLIHAKQFCSCAWSAKIFIIRYDINELNILIEAIEGKLSAVYKWAREKLGLYVHSYISKDSSQVPRFVGDPSSSEELKQKKYKSQDPEVSNGKLHPETKAPALQAIPLNDSVKIVDKTMGLTVASSGTVHDTLSEDKPSESSSGSISGSSSMSDSLGSGIGESKFDFVLTRKERLLSDLISNTPACVLEKEVNSIEVQKQKTVGCSKANPDIGPSNNSKSGKQMMQKSSPCSQGNIIFLSDDDDE